MMITKTVWPLILVVVALLIVGIAARLTVGLLFPDAPHDGLVMLRVFWAAFYLLVILVISGLIYYGRRHRA